MAEVGAHYNVLSLVYDLLDWPFETFRYPRIRRLMCGGLSGRILDAGCGTGKNFVYYPAGTEVTAVDLSRGMLARAAGRVAKASAKVTLLEGDATKLPFPDGHFDACVSTYMFCVLPDELQLPALKELLRVTRKGGVVRILEHRYSKRWWRLAIMKAYTWYTWYFFHSRYDHDVEAAVRASGATVLDERFVTSDVEKVYFLSPR